MTGELDRLRALIAFAREHRQLVVKLDIEDAEVILYSLSPVPFATPGCQSINHKGYLCELDDGHRDAHAAFRDKPYEVRWPNMSENDFDFGGAA